MEQRLLRIEATSGPIEVRFPASLTWDDVNDFEAHVAILLRVMRRISARDEAAARVPVSYDDEVTAEQAAAVAKHLAPEFAHGNWQTIESDTGIKT